MQNDFFPTKPDVQPQIYAYSDTNPQYKGLLKIGYTTKDVAKRVAQQYPTIRPREKPYKIVYQTEAIKEDGSAFSDHDVHKILKKKGCNNEAGEWFECTTEDIETVILELKLGQENVENRTSSFEMRPEQQQAVEKTIRYFESLKKDSDMTPRFLWNAKMRFGKTFATYQLAKKMGYKKVLVLTFKPAVEDAWERDLNTHIDFEGWQFISKKTELEYERVDTTRPFVCFGSFQDYLGTTQEGGIKHKNEWVHTINWDLIVFDEYHYGAWRERARDLFDDEQNIDQQEILAIEEQDKADYLEYLLPITANAYLYLSGTPFRALLSGEFIEEQIFNWTYSDEQNAKANWKGENNPYLILPQMILMTYQLPDEIVSIAKEGEFDTFDLNSFFSVTGEEGTAKFKYENDVQKWLDLIRGDYLHTSIDLLKMEKNKPPIPYSDTRLLNILSHTLWFLPNVGSCYAMKNLLAQKQNKFYHDYTVIVAAGKKAGIGLEALAPVKKAMGNSLKTKTITLSCGKLTTGVTIKPWTGVFMLRNLKSPETYFQTAFRVQSPWTVYNPDGTSPNKEEIIKKTCYIFDFAPNRALKQIADYSCKLNTSEQNSEEKVKDFIQFLPILAYDGSSMKEIDASGVLDMAMSGTTATLLARRWESALLVNVTNDVLKKLLANPSAMEALMKIEGFRNLNTDLEIIINKSEAVKKAKKELAHKENVTKEETKALSNEEKEYTSKRKEIQEKLVKFATRIPVFMYLTDFREQTLKDVITKLEPNLFKKVTGLEIKDFELLVSLGVFNSSLMNDAVFKFRRYEDSSLDYTGLNRHEHDTIGGWDTTISKEESIILGF